MRQMANNDGCFCGAGVRMDGDAMVITAHSPDCLWLHWIAALAADDVCAGCGYKFIVSRSGGFKSQQCKRCISYSAEWF